SAMRPGRKSAQQNQNQNDDENRRQHVAPLAKIDPEPAKKRAEGAWALLAARGKLDFSEQEQNEEDNEDQSDHARWTIAPAAAIGPRRERAEQDQDQDDDENGRKHGASLGSGAAKRDRGLRAGCFIQ